MADRFLDNLIEMSDQAYEHLKNVMYRDQRNREYQQGLADAYSQAIRQDPTLGMPKLEGKATDYDSVVKQILNNIANSGTVRNTEDALNAINSNPLVARRLEGQEETKLAIANDVARRSQEKGAFHQTHSEWLDEDNRNNLPQVNSDEEDKGMLRKAWDGIVDTAIDIGKMPFNALNLTEESRNSARRADLARQMNALGKDTVTGMNKLYSLEELQNQKNELEHSLSVGSISDPENAVRNLQIINSKIDAISNSLTNEERSAIERNKDKYNELKRERDYLNSINPDNFKKVTMQDYMDAKEQADLERNQLLTTGNADFFNLDNIGYDLKYLKNMANTPHEFGYLVGQMIPWAIGGAELGTVKTLDILGAGVGKALMGIGTKGASRQAFTRAFADISKGIMSKTGLAKAGAVGLTYAGAYSKSVSDNLNEYFDREGTVNGFSEMKAGLYGMAEEFANFYGGKIAGKFIPAGYLKKMFRSDVDDTLRALAPMLGTNAGGATQGALNQLLRRWTPESVMSRFSDKLGDIANKASNKVKLGTDIKTNKTIAKLASTAETASRIAGVALSNKTGISVGAMAKAGVSLATDNTFANIVHQKAQQKKEGINWKEVGESAAEGLVAGAVGHIGSMGANYAKQAVVNDKSDKKFFRSDEAHRAMLDKVHEEDNWGTLEAQAVLKQALNEVDSKKDTIDKYRKDELNKIVKKSSIAKELGGLQYNEADKKFLDKEGKEVDITKFKDGEKLLKKIQKKEAELDQFDEKRLQRFNEIQEELVNNANAYFAKEENKNKNIATDPLGQALFLDAESESDVVDVLNDLDRYKNYSEEEKKLEAKAILEGKADVSNQVDENALKVAKKMNSSGRDLINVSKEAQEALGKKDFGTFNSEVDKDITKINDEISKIRVDDKLTDKEKNKKIEEETKKINRLKEIQNKYTQDNYKKQEQSYRYKTPIDAENMSVEDIENISEDLIPELADINNHSKLQNTYTQDEFNGAMNALKKDTSLSEFVTNALSKLGDKATEDEIKDTKARATDLYRTLNRVIADNINAHNEIVNQGTHTRSSEKEVKDELKKAGLEDEYDVKKATIKKGGKEIDSWYAVEKQATLNKHIDKVQDIYTDLKNNGVNIKDQLDPTLGKNAQAKKDALDNIFADPKIKKVLRSKGYIYKGKELDSDNFLKLKKNIQLEVLGLAIASNIQDFNIKKNEVNKKKAKLDKDLGGRSVVSHFMTGHNISDDELRSIAIRKNAAKLKKLEKEKKKALDRIDKLDLNDYKKLKDSEVTKALVACLVSNNFMGNSYPDESSLLDQLYNAQRTAGASSLSAFISNNANARTISGIIYRWANNSNRHISQDMKDQLAFISRDLNERISKGSQGLDNISNIISSLNNLIQRVHVDSNSNTRFYIPNVRETFSQNENKSLLNEGTLNSLADALRISGFNPTTEIDSNLYDWDISDMTKLNIPTDLLSEDAQKFIQRANNELYIDMFNNLHNLLDATPSNALGNIIWNALAMVPIGNANRGLPTGENIATILSKEDVPGFIRKFLENKQRADEFANAYAQLSENQRNKLVDYLLSNRFILGTLGLVGYQNGYNARSLDAEHYWENIGSAYNDNLIDFRRVDRQIASLAGIGGRRSTYQRSIFRAYILSKLSSAKLANRVAVQDQITREMIHNIITVTEPQSRGLYTGRGARRRLDPNIFYNIIRDNILRLYSTRPGTADPLYNEIETILNNIGDVAGLDAIFNINNLVTSTIRMETPTYTVFEANIQRVSPGASNEAIAWLANRFGKIAQIASVTGLWVSIQNSTNVDSNIDVFTQLSIATANSKLAISQYNEHRHIEDDAISIANTKEYLKVLQGIEITDEMLEGLRRAGDKYFSTFLNKYEELIFNTNNNNLRYLNQNQISFENKEDELQFAKLLAELINDNYIANNMRYDNNNGTSNITILDRPNANTGRDTVRDAIANHEGINEHEDLRPRSDCIVSRENGLEQFASTAGSRQVNQIIDEINKVVSELDDCLLVNNHPMRLTDNIFSMDGKTWNQGYLRVVATAALSAFPSISTDVTDEYADTLLKRYKNPALVQTFREKELADVSVVQKQIGENIARSIGIRPTSPLFDDVAQEAGQHALIALAVMGYIELGRINTKDGKYYNNLKGSDLAGTVKVISITNKAFKNKLTNLDQFIDRGTTGSILDALLGRRQLNDKDPYSNNADFIQHNQDVQGLSNIDNARLVTAEGNGETIVRDDENEIVAIDIGRANQIKFGTNGVNTTQSAQPDHFWVFLSGKAIRKTDDTYVDDERLTELAYKTAETKYFNINEFLQDNAFMFDANNDFNVVYTLDDAETRLDHIVEEHPSIGVLFGYDDSFKKLTGEQRWNIQTKNKEAFKKLINKCNYIRRTFYRNNQWNRGDYGWHSMYFNEINTVNNRSFVDNLSFNYREDKLNRQYFTMYDPKFITHKSGVDGDAIDFKATVLANLGLDYDKMNDKQVNETWEKITKDHYFQELLKTVARYVNSSPNVNIDTVIQKIKEFNEHIPVEYKAFKPKYEGTGEKSQKIEIPTDADLIHHINGLVKLVKIAQTPPKSKRSQASRFQTLGEYLLSNQTGTTEEAIGKYLNDYFNAGNTIHNFNLTIEIDGLTNGPSIKAIASYLIASNNPAAKILLGAVGVSRRFIQITDAWQDGILDTYLLNGLLSQYDDLHNIMTNMFDTNFKTSTELKYLNSLFTGQDAVPNMFSVLSGILTRNIMKKPTMVTGYEAGEATVLLKMYQQFDLQASTLLGLPEQNDHLKTWLREAVKLNGGKLLMYKGKGKIPVMVDENGQMEDGSNIFDIDRSTLTFSTEDNAKLAENLANNILKPMYKSLCSIMRKNQEPYEMDAMATEAIAETANEVIVYEIANYMEEHKEIDPIDYRRIIDEIAENVTNKLSGILNIAGAQLQAFKKSVTRDITTAMSTMTSTRKDRPGGEIFLKTKYSRAALEALGAGETPMVIHSYDSWIIHSYQHEYRQRASKGMLGVHDAKIIDVSGVRDPGLNRFYFFSGAHQMATFACRDASLLQGLHNIESYDLPQNVKNRLKGRLQAVYNQSSISTLNLIMTHLNEMHKQLNLPENQRMKFNQYSLMGRTVYVPSTPDIQEYIRILNDALRNITNDRAFIDSAISVIKNSLREASNDIDANLYKSLWDILFDKNDNMKPKFTKNAYDIDSLVDNIRVQLGNDYLSNSAINDALDPVRILNTVTTANSDNPLNKIIEGFRGSAIADYNTNSDIGGRTTRNVDIINRKDSSYTRNELSCFVQDTIDILRQCGLWLGNDINAMITADESYAFKAIQSAIIRSAYNIKDEMTDLDKYSIINEAIGNELTKDQKHAFDVISSQILDSQLIGKVFLSNFDSNKNTILYRSDDEDYASLLASWESKENKDFILEDSEDNRRTRSREINKWFYKIMDQVAENLRGKEGQVVFTLNSKMDILRMNALQELISRKEPGFDKIDIVCIPGLSNINDSMPRVDKEVAIYNQIRRAVNDNKKMSIIYDATTASCNNRNNNLIALATNQRINKENLVDHNMFSENHKMYVNVDNGFKTQDYVSVDTIMPAQFTVNLYDEHGGELQNASYKRDEDGKLTGRLSHLLLRKSDVRNELLNEYDTEEVDKSDDGTNIDIVLNNKEEVGYEDYSESRMSDDNWNSIDSLKNNFTDPSIAIGINITSNGDIIGGVPSALGKNINILSKAVARLKSDMDNDYAEYMTGSNGMTWGKYTRVRPITVNLGDGRKKTFVFTVTQDTSVTKGELINAIRKEVTTRGKTINAEVIKGTAFAKMLNSEHLNNVNKTSKFVFANASDSIMNKDKRVRIPMHMLNDNILEIDNTPEELEVRNARYLARVNEKLNGYGIHDITYLHSNRYDVGNDRQVLPINMRYSWTDLSGFKLASIEELNSNINQEISGRKNNIINKVFDRFKYFNNVRVRFMTGHDSNNRLGLAIAGYLKDLNQERLSTSNDYNKVINEVMLADTKNNVNISHLNPIASVLRGMMGDVTLFVDKTVSTSKSMQMTMLDENTRSNYVYLGWGQTNESKTEALFHELCHVVFDYLHLDPTAMRGAVELFNYVQKNLKITDFEDGDTLENRHIMDAIFSEKTKDNLSEFLVYTLTNEKFIKAMSNMKVPSKVKDAIEGRSRGIFNRIANKISGVTEGPEIAGLNMYEAVYNIFEACMNTSRKYNEDNSTWNQINELGGEVAEDIYKLDVLAKEGAVTSKVREFLATVTDKIFEAFTGKESKVGDVIRNATRATYMEVDDIDPVPLLCNTIREQCDIKEGFANDLLASLEGASKNQYEYMKLRMEGKVSIDACREQACSAINTRVKEILSDLPSKYEKKLTDYFVRADVSCLFNSTMKAEDVKELLTNKETRKTKIKELEKAVKSNKWGDFYINATKGLAQYLTTGFNPTGLAYRNAYEIASLAGSSYQSNVDFTGPLVRNIDQLSTLYAVDYLANKDESVYNALTPKVLQQLSAVHNGIKQSEIETVYEDSKQKYHIPKGQLHGGRPKGRYDIVPESELKAYRWSGYTKISEAKLDPFYKGISKEKYYLVGAKYKGSPSTTAGITVMTDIFKGRNKSGLSYNHKGEVDKEIDFTRTEEFTKLRSYVNQRVNALNVASPKLLQEETSGNLVLNFNYLGNMSGANFELNPLETDLRIGRNIKTSSVFGDLYGSVVERAQAPSYNKKVGEAIIEIYENAEDKENFIWVSGTSENEKYREYYESLPLAVKEACAEKYQDKGIPVRLKALNTVFGYTNRSANDIEAYKKDLAKREENSGVIADAFTNVIKDLFYSKYTGLAETFFKWCASTGKENLLIKGISTSWNNIVSNCVTLGMNGLSPKDVAKFQAEGFKYVKEIYDLRNQLKLLQAKQVEGSYTTQDAMSEKVIKNAIHRSPLYPLMKQGVIDNSIAEDLSESDRFLKDTIDKYSNKGFLNTALHNALLTPKAKLYGVLQDLASLGDTVGKYALYKHLTSKGISQEEAMRQAVNTFIDYSNPTPKDIQYLDDLGILPFIKYTLGTQTNILNTLVKHPDRALGWIAANNAFGLEIPDIFSSLIGPGLIADKLQLPSNMFLDSIGQLPSIRTTNTLGITSI